MAVFLAAGCRDHFECKIGSLGTTVEYGEFDSEGVPEVIYDILPDVRFGGRGQAENGRHRTATRLLMNETADIAIVGPKVVSPARQTVCLVEHPSADLPLIERAAQGPGTELLGGNEENARISEPHPIQSVLTLRKGEEAVYRDAAADPARFQSRHLVRHQRDQGRDHDGQRSGLVITRQGRNLVAERLSGTGRQNREDMLSRHGSLDDGLLQGPSVLARGFRAETVEAEPALQFLAWIMVFPAPTAFRVRAGEVPERPDKSPRLRKLVAHPRRHHRIAAGHGDPRQGVRHLPAPVLDCLQGQEHLRCAGFTVQTRENRGPRFIIRRSARAPNVRKQTIEGAIGLVRVRRAQPVPRREKIGFSTGQRQLLVTEDLQRQAGVQLRVIAHSAFQRAILIVLHEMVIRVAGKGERAETERVDRRQVQEPQIRTCGSQVRQIESDQVVAEQKGRPIGELVQPPKGPGQAISGRRQALARIRPHRANRLDAAVRPAHLEVQRQSGKPERVSIARGFRFPFAHLPRSLSDCC